MKITRDELKSHISGTILSMQGVDFDVEEVEKLKQVIASAPEQELHDSLDILVDQIFKGQEIAGDEMSFK